MEATENTTPLNDADALPVDPVIEPADIDKLIGELLANVRELHTQTDALVQEVVSLRQRIKLLELGW